MPQGTMTDTEYDMSFQKAQDEQTDTTRLGHLSNLMRLIEDIIVQLEDEDVRDELYHSVPTFSKKVEEAFLARPDVE